MAEIDRKQGAIFVTDMPTPESANAARQRAIEYGKLWRQQLAEGKELTGVITDPSNTTVEDAIKNQS